MYHEAVLLNESIAGLNINPEGTYVDVTFGGGGHSEQILNKLSTGRLLSFDQDEDAEKNSIAFNEKYGDKKFTFIRHNFRFINNFLRYHKAFPVDGILADLGISSHQINKGERGFSFRFDNELDMRMNKNLRKSAKDIVNNYSVSRLTSIFKKYGELKNAHKIAEIIERQRNIKPICTTGELTNVVHPVLISPKQKNKENSLLAQLFQAIRIEVNGEMDVLAKFLEQTISSLKTGGRLVVITYHSLEDRLVKNFIKTGNTKGEQEKDIYGNVKTPLKAVNKKIITANDTEIKQNNRARSAKLRIAEKI